MSEMTIQEQEAYFLRKTAIHECGHVTVVRHFGIEGIPVLCRNNNPNPGDEKLWFGKTICSLQNSTPAQRRQIGMAGIIADLMAGFPSPSECDEYFLNDEFEETFGENYDESYGWSESDWESAKGWTIEDIRTVYTILESNWNALMQEVEMLAASADGKNMVITTPEMLATIMNSPKPEQTDLTSESFGSEHLAEVVPGD